LLVDKPEGWTSFDVVAKVRGFATEYIKLSHVQRGFCIESQSAEWANGAAKRTRKYGERAVESGDKAVASKAAKSSGFATAWSCRCKARVGHAGTLDPFATGLLILLIGKATKQADKFIKLDKSYEATLFLGATSTTGDPEGEITPSHKENVVSNKDIQQVLKRFTGGITQTPPKFSAIKVNGQRAYKLARAGQEITLQPRLVTIYDISGITYTYPKLRLHVKVSSGTYIRSLAVDIGEQLGVGAYLAALRRTTIAGYNLAGALSVADLTFAAIRSHLIPEKE